MIPLPIQFEGVGVVKGFHFQQICKVENIGYIYMVSTDDVVYYEVFKHREVAILIDFETRTYSETETKVTYPKANDFGYWAWTYKSHKKAQDKLTQIIEDHG